jgi:aryl-alcohol dehydrogenase-like predicted oxidoreductase
MIWSPLARGRLWRPWGETTARSAKDPYQDMLYAGTEEAARAIVGAVQQVAEARGVPMAQVALAWLRRNPVVTAPIVGATKPHHIDDAVAALDLTLSDDEARLLEAGYTPRYDFQGVSEPKVIRQISERVGIRPAA